MRAVLVFFFVALAAPALAGEPCDDSGSVDCCSSGGELETPDLCPPAPSTDAAPDDLVIHSASAYPQGTQTASDLILAGGLDEKYVTVDDYSLGSTDTVTLTINGADTTLTEGTDFDCLTDNATCAAALATAIDAVSGVAAAAVSAVVYLEPDQCGTYNLNTAVADGGVDGVFATATNGTDGSVILRGGEAYVDTDALALDGIYLFDPDRALRVGAECNPASMADSSGNVVVCGELSLENDVYLQSDLTTVGGKDIGWGSAGIAQYWITYNAGNTRLLFQSATGGTLVEIDNSTQYLQFHVNNKNSTTNLKGITESVTFAGDASKATTGSVIPSGVFVVGVSGRVTTALTNCTSIDVGIAAKDTDAFADGVAIALGTTFTTSDGNVGADYSAASLGLLPNVAAQEITVTAVGGNCNAGVVALTVHYIDVTAATAN